MKISCTYKPYLILGMLAFVGMKSSSAATDRTEPQEVWINVFIHGIMSIKPHLSWNNFMNFMRDEVEGTLYEKSIEIMRENPFFYKNQAMQQPGFHRVMPSMTEGNSSASLSYILDEVTNHYGLNHTNYYYTFGWTGLMSSKIRYRDSRDLFKALETEVSNLKKNNIVPRVRIIGYSHGGNIGLNLGAVHQREFSHSKLSIDELILLGTPIINDSDYLISDPIFKRVYHLYSITDRVQTLDVFSPNKLFSDRLFKPRKGFDLPDKLVQIQLKVTRCKPQVRNDKQRFESSSDLTKPSIVYGRKGPLRDVSPGHAELWFFGWTPMHYRERYPLYPMPTASFIPVITHHAEQIAQNQKMKKSVIKSVIADIRPEHNVILFRETDSASIHSTVSYLPEQKITFIRDAIMQAKPSFYTADMYQAHVQESIKQAKVLVDTHINKEIKAAKS